MPTSLGLVETLQVEATDDRSEFGDYRPEAVPAVAINPDSDLRELAREKGWEIKDFRTARKAAKIGVPSALALGAVGGAVAAAVSRRHEQDGA